VEVIATAESIQNGERLASGEANLALLQTRAIQPESISVVALLYYDAIHIIVRQPSDVRTQTDLRGKKISIGLDGSGMQLTSRSVLAHYGIDDDDLVAPNVHFRILDEDLSYEAAIVTTGSANEDLGKLLASGDFSLIAIPDGDREQLTDAFLRSHTIRRGTYSPATGTGAVPREDIETLATTSFLAAEKNASPQLVTRVLEALYYDSNLVVALDLLSLGEAAEWRMLNLHPTAREFFRARSAPDAL
jgi:TRAP transporter TAXI family solute receptor